jgi:hypothetical protein
VLLTTEDTECAGESSARPSFDVQSQSIAFGVPSAIVLVTE